MATIQQANTIIALLGDIVKTASLTGGGALIFQGDYDVAGNSPDLEAPAPGDVKKGYYYVASTSGLFFTEQVDPGDTLFAKVNDPSSLTDWVVVQNNIDDSLLTKEAWSYSAGNTTTINPGLGAQDLLRAGGSFTNQTPFVVPTACELRYISVSATSVDVGTSWEAHVLKNGVSVAQVNLGVGVSKGNSSILAISFAVGDEVRLRVQNVSGGLGVTGAGIDSYFKAV